MLEGLDLSGVDYLSLAIGAVLIVFGKRLYWLALGAAGFWLGLYAGTQLLPNADEAARLGLAVLLGIAGVVAAVLAQKLAITIGGLVVGGFGLLWLSQPWHADFGQLVWLVAVLGAVLGAVFASMLFDLALIVLSSWIGAALVVEALGLAERVAPWVFLGLMVVGYVVQTRAERRDRI